MSSEHEKKSKKRLQLINGWRFFLPPFLILMVVVGIPLVGSFNYSLREVFLYRFRTQPFVGLENYRLLVQDPIFWISTRITFMYTAGVTIASVFLGFLIALVLNRKDLKGHSFFIAIFLLPFVATPVVIGIVWRLLMWEPDYGLINYFLSFFGISGGGWLIERSTALPSVIVTNVWRLSPLAMLIFYAALKTVPEEMLEGAKIDGAGWWSVASKIIFPLLKNHFLFISLVIMTSAFREFDTVYSLTGGGPGRSTYVLSMLVYHRGINNADMGFANAVAVSMFIFVGIVSIIFIKKFSIQDSHF